MKRITSITVLFFAFLFAYATNLAYAAPNEVKILKEEVDMLRGEVAQMRIEVKTLTLTMTALANKMTSAMRQTEAKAYCGATKTELANLAMYEEAYFTDHDKYTSDFSELADAGYEKGDSMSVNVTKVTPVSWRAKASHPKCDRKFIWDSDGGGLQ